MFLDIEHQGDNMRNFKYRETQEKRLYIIKNI